MSPINEEGVGKAAADKEGMPEKLYVRIGAVLRSNSINTQEILQEYYESGQYDRKLIGMLYRDALRKEPPAAEVKATGPQQAN